MATTSSSQSLSPDCSQFKLAPRRTCCSDQQTSFDPGCSLDQSMSSTTRRSLFRARGAPDLSDIDHELRGYWCVEQPPRIKPITTCPGTSDLFQKVITAMMRSARSISPFIPRAILHDTTNWQCLGHQQTRLHSFVVTYDRP